MPLERADTGQLGVILPGQKAKWEHIAVKILAIEQEVAGVTGEAFKPYLEKEAARVWELYQAGVFRELYFRQDQTSAVLVLECADVQEACEILGSLPLAQQGLITFEVIPVVAYPGFARLFGKG